MEPYFGSTNDREQMFVDCLDGETNCPDENLCCKNPNGEMMCCDVGSDVSSNDLCNFGSRS